jgi:hypothetical protein
LRSGRIPPAEEMQVQTQRAISLYLPVPVSETKRGPPGSEVTMLMVPRRGPVIAGLKVTAMVQLAPVAKLVPQV